MAEGLPLLREVLDRMYAVQTASKKLARIRDDEMRAKLALGHAQRRLHDLLDEIQEPKA